MAKEFLSTDDFTFLSFKHSQASPNAQVQIFRYFDLMWGLQPNLNPSEDETKRYEAYISSNRDSKRHIHLRPSDAAEEFDKLSEKYEKDLEQLPNKTMGQVCTDLASMLVDKEVRILDWRLRHKGPAHFTRVRERVTSGRSSFVLLHGRDGVSTNSTQFDHMYQDVWNSVEDLPEDPETQFAPLCRLEKAVYDAEMAILGRTILGQEVIQQ